MELRTRNIQINKNWSTAELLDICEALRSQLVGNHYERHYVTFDNINWDSIEIPNRTKTECKHILRTICKITKKTRTITEVLDDFQVIENIEFSLSFSQAFLILHAAGPLNNFFFVVLLIETN